VVALPDDRLPRRREIHCFEPDEVNLKYLRLNRERNGLANWTIRPLAVSDRRGTPRSSPTA
jgi:FkbM family methyltransferase